jgi:hypothetical protein
MDRASKFVDKCDESVVDKQEIATAVKTLETSGGPNKPESIRILRKAGYNDIRIKKLLSDAGHTLEEITTLMSSVGRM